MADVDPALDIGESKKFPYGSEGFLALKRCCKNNEIDCRNSGPDVGGVSGNSILKSDSGVGVNIG